MISMDHIPPLGVWYYRPGYAFSPADAAVAPLRHKVARIIVADRSVDALRLTRTGWMFDVGPNRLSYTLDVIEALRMVMTPTGAQVTVRLIPPVEEMVQKAIPADPDPAGLYLAKIEQLYAGTIHEGQVKAITAWSGGANTAVNSYEAMYQDLKKLFPAVLTKIQCPFMETVKGDIMTVTDATGVPIAVFEGHTEQVQCTKYMRVNEMIIHLNDGHRWTRETIADWLETLDLDLTVPIPTNPAPTPGTEPEGSTS